MTTDAEPIAAVLGRHRLIDLHDAGGEVLAVRCACREFSTDVFDGLEARHEAHVANALLAVGIGPVREAWGKGYAAGREDFRGRVDVDPRQQAHNPYQQGSSYE